MSDPVTFAGLTKEVSVPVLNVTIAPAAVSHRQKLK